MPTVDVALLEYKVIAVTDSGESLDLTQFVINCTWGDKEKEVAASANITFANIKSEKGYINALLKLCTLIFIYANGQEVFRGIVWEYDYNSAAQKEVSIVCYDKAKYLTQSKSSEYYTSGKSTSAIVNDICGKWGVSVNYAWQSYTHAKICFKSKAISEQIFETLEEAKSKLSSKYAVYMDKDVLQIKERGSNSDVYIFDTTNSISIKNKLSMSQLVTKVLILGKEDKEGRSNVEATVTGKTEYGTLQEVIYRDSDASISDAKAEAQQIINEKGSPEETITIQSADLPFTRKGDKIKVTMGTFDTYLYVKSVTHDAVKRTMSMECER